MSSHINIDLSGLQDPNAPAPDGIYDLLCTEAEDTHSKTSGNAMVKATMEIQGGEYAGKLIFENWVLEGDGARFGGWTYAQVLRACGGDPSAPNVEDIRGKTFRAMVVIEPSTDPQYRDKNRIKDVLL